MSVNIPNPGSYLAQLGQHVVNLQAAISDLIQDGTYLNAMGGAAFLEGPPFSLSAGDAALIESTIGAVTPSNAVVQQINAFITSAVPLTGGNVS